MDYANLPDIAVKLALRHALTPKPDLSQALEFLWVCSSWRRLGLALVFAHAYFLETKPPPSSDTPEESSDESPFRNCDTNIHMIVASKSTKYVKSLAISFCKTTTLSHFLQDMDKIMGFTTHSQWLNVRSFQTSARSPSRTDEEARIVLMRDRATHVNIQRTFIEALQENLPRIDTLVVHASDDSWLSTETTNVFVNSFLPQLTRLQATDIPVSFSDQQQMAGNLTTIKAKMNRHRPVILPHMVPEQMNLIELLDVPRTFDWSCFDPSGQKTEISFDNLHSLKLVFKGEAADQNVSRRYKVIFPKLKTLAVIGWHQSYTLFTSTVFPSHLHRLQLSECTQAMAEISHTHTINTVDSLTINIPQNARSNEDMFYQITNYYFSPTLCSTFNEFYLGCSLRNFVPENVNWHSLLFLQISSTITFSQILALLPHCPTLRDLTISDMVFESNSEFTQLPDNLKVEKLMILSLYDHNMIDHIRECIGYLVVNLRRLSCFVTTVDAHQYLNDLVEREKSDYPHLEDLDMSSKNMFL
ncbi:hypothetical protein IWW45_000683 [Coemansia sp. RSA 485]|nr:hypothetical protein IWW45_000683 [Coemansia sp. RSA 485]